MPRSRAFAAALTGCSVGRDDLARGELHRTICVYMYIKHIYIYIYIHICNYILYTLYNIQHMYMNVTYEHII